MMGWLFGLLLILMQTAVAMAGDYCYIDYQYEWCQYGCCGQFPNRYCCPVYSWIIGLCITIGIIIAIGACVVFMCCVQKKKARGRVISPGTQTITTVTTVNQGPPMNNYGFQQQPPPPPYQAMPQPPPYQGTHQLPPYQIAHQPQSYQGVSPLEPNYAAATGSNHDPTYPPPAAAQYNTKPMSM